MRVHYLEAYCRANSHTTDWSKHTVVGHTTEQVSAIRDGTRIELLFMLGDGVPVRHVIPSTYDEVDFLLGGFKPGDPLNVKGKIYLVGNDLDKLLERYWRDFPEHKKLHMK